MNVVPLPAPRAAAGPAEAGALAGLLLGRGIGLLLGWHTDRLPRRGRVGAAGTALGPYRLTAWPRAAGGCWFLAAVQAPGGLQPGGAVLELHAPELPPRPLTPWAEQTLDAPALAQALAARAGGYAGAIAQFLVELVTSAAPAAVPPLTSLLESFCAAAAEADGAVEVILPAAGALVLQGWGDEAALDGAEALLLGGTPCRFPVQALRFARDDIAAPRCGLVELIETPEPDRLPPDRLLLVVGKRLKHRRLVERPMRLPCAEGAQHLREMQARLDGGEAALALLRRVLRPAYGGVETLGQLDGPLAAALDLCLLLPGQGVFLNGWLADPCGRLAGLALTGPAGFRADLAPHWQRIERPDVAAGLAAEPRFAALVGDRHGFAAFLPGPAPALRDGWHLTVDTVDGGVGYLPLRPLAVAPREGLRRAAGLIDLHRASGPLLAERVLGMALAAVMPRLDLPPFHVVQPAQRASRALLLALPRPDGPASAALSGFLADPLAADEALVVICGAGWRGTALAQLQAALRFYGIPAGLALTEGVPELPEAWEIGARLSGAAELVPLTAAGPVGAPGWRQALRQALPAGAGVAAPMLLHEDAAVRSLGFVAGRAGIPLRWPGAGLPAAALPEVAPRPVLGAAMEGALISHAAWEAAGGFASVGLTGPSQEAGFFLRLAAAGGHTTMLPAVRLSAPEPAVPEEAWRAAAGLAELGLLAGLLPTEESPACES